MKYEVSYVNFGLGNIFILMVFLYICCA